MCVIENDLTVRRDGSAEAFFSFCAEPDEIIGGWLNPTTGLLCLIVRSSSESDSLPLPFLARCLSVLVCHRPYFLVGEDSLAARCSESAGGAPRKNAAMLPNTDPWPDVRRVRLAVDPGGAEAEETDENFSRPSICPSILGLVFLPTLLERFANRSFSRTSYPSSSSSALLPPPGSSSSTGNVWSEIECAGGMCSRAGTELSGSFVACVVWEADCEGPMEERSDDGPSGRGLYALNVGLVIAVRDIINERR